MTTRRSLDEVLRSTSDVLFPDQGGRQPVGIGSRGLEGDTPLHVMTWRQDRDAVQLLLEAGAEVDAVGDMDQTPLHVATMQQDEAIAELLLRAGADPGIRSEFGDTPRELADRQGGGMLALFRRYAAR